MYLNGHLFLINHIYPSTIGVVKYCLVILTFIFTCNTSCIAQSAATKGIKVSKDGHFFEDENGKPFIWLGDTAWRLFANLDSTEIITYFKTRKKQGFNVIQCSLLHGGIDEKNNYGQTAFINNDLTKHNPEWWQYADYIIKKGSEYGFQLAILPAWSRTYTETLPKDEPKPKIFESDTVAAYNFGYFVANRYKAYKNIIWVLGGDAYPKKHVIYENLAKGIDDAYGPELRNQNMLTYHPNGGTYRAPATSSGEFYHSKKWLDFNMIQSGHRIGNRNFERIFEDYLRQPVKPTIDAEPCYEHHPNIHNYSNGEIFANHVRNRAYWSILAGAAGFTYGATGMYDMSKPERKGKMSHFKDYWYDAINYEGAQQMIHVKSLFESRSYTYPPHMPDSTLVLNHTKKTESHVQVARTINYENIIAYFTDGSPAQLDIFKSNEKKYICYWYNPRDGKTYDAKGKPSKKGFIITKTKVAPKFIPPGKVGENNDWVLVLDKPKLYPNIPGEIK
jgi:hypothetical protein